MITPDRYPLCNLSKGKSVVTKGISDGGYGADAV